MSPSFTRKNLRILVKLNNCAQGTTVSTDTFCLVRMSTLFDVSASLVYDLVERKERISHRLTRDYTHSIVLQCFTNYARFAFMPFHVSVLLPTAYFQCSTRTLHCLQCVCRQIVALECVPFTQIFYGLSESNM